MSRHSVAAGKFKAECLALIDRVARTGKALVITKRGRPVAQLAPLQSDVTFRSLKGSVLEDDDIVSPLEATWEAGK